MATLGGHWVVGEVGNGLRKEGGMSRSETIFSSISSARWKPPIVAISRTGGSLPGLWNI
jgi:hypothetical protein